jgi:hypothetical protein
MATLFKEVNGKLEMMEGGARSEAIKWKNDKSFDSIISNRPTVGCSMRVGSITARTYSNRDWWMTTPVVEILEETEDRVRFRTKNSIYVWLR